MKRYKAAIKEQLLYRKPMKVSQRFVYRNGSSFAICPRCGRVVEMEYQAFCGCCGQTLNWTIFKSASVYYI